MRALENFVFLAVVSCQSTSSETATVDESDPPILKRMIALAEEGPGTRLREDLEALVRSLKTPELRSDALASLEDILRASESYRRRQVLERKVRDLDGKVTTEPGGPAWLKGEGSFTLFAKVVAIDLGDRSSPHSKDYRLNVRVNDEALQPMADFPELRSISVANADVRGPGLKFLSSLRNLERLDLTLTPISEESLSSLSPLTQLKNLCLASTKVKGPGFRHLAPLTRLENLNCHSVPLEDEALQWIGKLSGLKRLEIVHTRFTDAGAAYLSNLSNLERFQLGSPKATGASLAFLKNLPNLRELDIHDSLVTPEGFSHLGTLVSLRVLRVAPGPVGDEGIAPLGRLANLETLVLSQTGMTDRGLEHLLGLKHLKRIELHEPKVTESGAAKLQSALPGLELVRK